MRRLKSIAGEALRHFVLCIGAVLIVLPFVWALSISVRPPDQIFTPEVRLLPDSFAVARNYGMALTRMPLLQFILNGLIVCTAILVCQLIVLLPCAYALAKLQFKGKDLLFALVLVGLMVPPTVLSLPLFIMVSSVGWIDTYAALVLPWTISVFGIFLMRQMFLRIPDDYIDAGRMDGLSEPEILLGIMVPMALPAIVAFSIFSVVRHWNDLFWPSVVTRSIGMATPPYGVLLFQSDEAGSDYGALMAGAVIIAAPMIIAFLLAHRRFIEGFSAGAQK